MHQSFTSAAGRTFPHPVGVARRRLNASQKLFQRGDLPAEFFRLLEKFFERYGPSNLNDARAVADAVRAAWFYLRHSRARKTFEITLRRRKPDSTEWLLAESDKLAALTYYHHRARRGLLPALKKIRHLRKTRTDQAVSRELLSLFMGIFDMDLAEMGR